MVFQLQYLSILIEVAIASMGILIVTKKKKKYGWGIFLTFFIYVFYDLSKLIALNIPSPLLYSLFFIATVSALWAVWKIYSEGKVKPNKEKTRSKKKWFHYP